MNFELKSLTPAQAAQLPADALLVSADGVQADESLLTGEPVPVGKRVARADELVDVGQRADAARVVPGGDGLPVVYAGTRLDLYVINGGCCPRDHYGADAPAYPRLDLPGSMLLDTLLLPLSLLTAAGIGFQATGGL